jgi:hypothetical protein
MKLDKKDIFLFVVIAIAALVLFLPQLLSGRPVATTHS